MNVLVLFSLFFLVQISVQRDQCPEEAVEGPKGFKNCYLFERFPAKFIIAEQNCRKSGGNLPSIHNNLTNEFISQIGDEAFDILRASDFWVGAHNLRDNSKWEWIDNSTFDYTNWPKNKYRSDGCLALSLDGSWNAVDCYLDKPYVCQVPRVPSPTTPKPVITTTIKPTTIRTTSTRKIVTTTKKPGTTCPFGWSYLSGKCYKVINVFTNPLGCYPYSAVEASIHNDEQNQLIGQLAKKQSIIPFANVEVRLSLRDSSFNRDGNKPNWQWRDNSKADYFKWKKGQPSKFGSCVELNSNKNDWNVVNCLLPGQYIACVKSA